MCEREMTLGEEIINLVGKGIDVPTVERIYRKYIDLDEKVKSDDAYAIDLEPIFGTGHIARYHYSILPANINVGDQIEIPLGNLGTFTATAQVITEDKVLFLFDDYVDKRPMNENGSNDGGYDESDLKKWIDTELYKMFSEAIRKRMRGLTIPTVVEICGWGDEWNRRHFERDDHAQLPLMKQRRNRVAYYTNECSRGWLRNATKKESSSAHFAIVNLHGSTFCNRASASCGIRPEFWLEK